MEMSKRAKNIPPSGIREMFALADQYDNVVSLGIGQPSFETPENIVRAGCEALKNGYTKYAPNAGYERLREAVAEKMTRFNKYPTKAENIMITVGAGQALMLALQILTDCGDEVIMPDPTFPNYWGYAHVAGAKSISAPTYEKDGFHITADAIAEKLTPKTKVVLINSPSNPTGAVLTKEELEKIAELALAHNFIILSDEPYETIIFDGREHISIGAFPGMENNVVTVNSFSKTYAMTGWRAGYLRAPKEVVDMMTIYQESILSCVNSATQMACIEALQGPQDAVWQMTEIYQKRRDLLINGLNELKGFSCIKSEGAFYAFANIKELGKSSVEVAKMLLAEAGVVTTPGSAFGEFGEGYLRFSFASEEKVIEEGLMRMSKVFK